MWWMNPKYDGNYSFREAVRQLDLEEKSGEK
jgi:hypothetical protein